jgi:ankyrin repeat protein
MLTKLSRTVLIALCAAALLTLAGCGEGSEDTNKSDQPGGSGDQSATTPDDASSRATEETESSDSTSAPAIRTVSSPSNPAPERTSLSGEGTPATPAAQPVATVAATTGDKGDKSTAGATKTQSTESGKPAKQTGTKTNDGSAQTTSAAGTSSTASSGKTDKTGSARDRTAQAGTARDAGGDLLTASRRAAAAAQAGSDQVGTDTSVKAEPMKLDLGEIPTNDSATGIVTLTNTGTEPRTLIRCKTNCGCTAANCPKGKTLEPGESVEIEIRLSGGSTPRKLNKRVTFFLQDHAPINVNIEAQAVSFVVIEPELLNPDTNPEGKVTLKAVDGEPFVIRTMYPPLVDEFSTERKAEQVVYLDWDKWAEANRQRRFIFTIDHPKTKRVYARIDPKVARQTPPRPPIKPGEDNRRAQRPVNPNLEAMLRNGQSKEIVKMIEVGTIEPNEADRTGKTPLLKAAHHGDVQVIEALLDASADISATDRSGKTALMWAAQSKNVEAVRALMDAGADLKKHDNIGSTALTWAAGFGDAATVKELIASGADIEVNSGPTGFTPLIWASGFGDPAAVRVLIDAGANLEVHDALQGFTPLMHAVRTGKIENVRLLIEAGADLEARNHKGQTVLLVAADNSGATEEVAQLLIEAGADVTAVDDAEFSALDLARKRTDPRGGAVVALLEKVMGRTAQTEGGDDASGK